MYAPPSQNPPYNGAAYETAMKALHKKETTLHKGYSEDRWYPILSKCTKVFHSIVKP